ncbi:hypothetical protein EVA_22047, partial [gut metagenome]
PGKLGEDEENCGPKWDEFALIDEIHGFNSFLWDYLSFSYVNIKRPTCVVGQVYTKITIKPSILDKRKISTHDSISADIV